MYGECSVLDLIHSRVSYLNQITIACGPFTMDWVHPLLSHQCGDSSYLPCIWGNNISYAW